MNLLSLDLDAALPDEGIATKSQGAANLTSMSPDGWDAMEQWNDLSFAIGLDTSPFLGARRDNVGLSLAIQCADVKARDISKTKMRLWRQVGDQWKIQKSKDHWLAKLLATRPSELHSWTEFWRMTVLHLDLAQNAYILKDLQRDGTVTGLLPWMPARIRQRVSGDGELFYEIGAATEYERAQLGGYRVILPAERVIHLRGRLLDGLTGLSNVLLGNPIFNLLGAISHYQTRLFGNDGTTPLVFETDQTFQGEHADAAFRRLKQQLSERTRKMNTNGDPILLEAGLKAKAIAVNSREAMTAESFDQQVVRVCSLMQCPPHKIYALNSVKYDNQSAMDNQYANDCLIPLAHNIEEKVKNSLLPMDDWEDWDLEFERMPMLAGDPATLTNMLHTAALDGALEINEYRERLPLSLNPVAGGNVRYVPVNMAMVGRDGKVIQQAASGQPNNDGTTEKPPAQAGGQRGLALVADNT